MIKFCLVFAILSNILTVWAQEKPYISEVPMAPKEIEFVTNLNQFRARDSESPLEYKVYETNNGTRYLWTTLFQGDALSHIHTQAHLFFSKLYGLTNGAPVVTEIFAGFSAADYDRAMLRADLQAYTKATIAENKRHYGLNTKTVFIGGATAEGIGFIYSDEISGPDLLKTGIVSNQALAYEMKYGNQIAKQDLIYLVDTFVDEKGEKSWEVKPGQGEESYNNSAHDYIDSKKSKFNLFEGGDIGLKEGLEWLENRSSASFAHKRYTLNLFVGYQAAKAKKDKGYRAASQLTQILLRFPELIPKNVTVNIYSAGKVSNGPLNFDNFKKTKAAQRLLNKNSLSFFRYFEKKKSELELQKQKYPDWYKKNQDRLDVEIRILEAWTKIDDVPLKVFKESQERNKRSMAHWQMVMDPKSILHPDDKYDRETGIAAQSANLLRIKINLLDTVMGRLSPALDHSVSKCSGFFKGL